MMLVIWLKSNLSPRCRPALIGTANHLSRPQASSLQKSVRRGIEPPYPTWRVGASTSNASNANGPVAGISIAGLTAGTPSDPCTELQIDSLPSDF